MGFFSFLGRLLFASIFILAAWQEFNDWGDDGGPAVRAWTPKLASIQRFLTKKFGKGGPNIDVTHFVAASMVLKGLGGLLFVFGSTMGAYLLMYHLLYMAPLKFDFYNYHEDNPEYFYNLEEFLKCVAFFGALLYFVGMKNSLSRRLKKKTPKPKSA